MKPIPLTHHFKWSEALCTNTGLDNIPNDFQRANLLQTFRILERVRQYLGVPLYINSAFRSEAVNRAVGGVSNSLHLEGRAVDISTHNLSERDKTKLWNNLLTYSPYEIYENKQKNYIHVSF